MTTPQILVINQSCFFSPSRPQSGDISREFNSFSRKGFSKLKNNKSFEEDSNLRASCGTSAVFLSEDKENINRVLNQNKLSS